MKAEIIAIGTELLLGQTVDTNTAEISTWLAEMGIGVYYHQTVGDNAERMTDVLSLAKSRSDLIIITGGLGPTEDDLTREIVARVTGLPLIRNEEALRQIQSFFQSAGRTMPENNLRQAYLPEGARMLHNSVGTAPGIYVKAGDTHFFCVPGVPSEMRTMWKEAVVPILREIIDDDSVIASRTLRFYGIGESDLETKVADLLHNTNPTVAPYAGNGEVRLRITARADSYESARQLIAPFEKEITARVGAHLYGYDDDTLEGVVAQSLLEKGLTVSTAESCTGGLIAHRLTNIPGSSGYFRQGWTVYSNESKIQQLGVDPGLLDRYGAVSEQVAREMASGALSRSQSDLALAVTGIAGPTGGTETKPVGLVFFGVAGFGQVKVVSRQFRPGAREEVKWRIANEGLNLLRLAIESRQTS